MNSWERVEKKLLNYCKQSIFFFHKFCDFPLIFIFWRLFLKKSLLNNIKTFLMCFIIKIIGLYKFFTMDNLVKILHFLHYAIPNGIIPKFLWMFFIDKVDSMSLFIISLSGKVMRHPILIKMFLPKSLKQCTFFSRISTNCHFFTLSAGKNIFLFEQN